MFALELEVGGSVRSVVGKEKTGRDGFRFGRCGRWLVGQGFQVRVGLDGEKR